MFVGRIYIYLLEVKLLYDPVRPSVFHNFLSITSMLLSEHLFFLAYLYTMDLFRLVQIISSAQVHLTNLEKMNDKLLDVLVSTNSGKLS